MINRKTVRHAVRMVEDCIHGKHGDKYTGWGSAIKKSADDTGLPYDIVSRAFHGKFNGHALHTNLATIANMRKNRNFSEARMVFELMQPRVME